MGAAVFMAAVTVGAQTVENSVQARSRPPAPKPAVLDAGAFQHFVEEFNRNDNELYKGFYSNGVAWDFLRNNIPLFDSPDQEINEIYYFRWWTYRKHIEKTPAGYIVSEFLPQVSWAGLYNSIDCAAGHHFHEGRWLADPAYLDDYSRFWFGKGGEPRRYSFWAAESLWARYQVTGDSRLLKELLPNLITNYEAWEGDHRDDNGLFWQIDDRDGMEVSLGGNGYRPTINSYMYGDAVAIANIAKLAGQKAIADNFLTRAARLKALVQENLWDTNAAFFKVLPRRQNSRLVEVREELGYTLWYFDLPDADKSAAWSQIMDTNGFYAPFGPTTAEQRNPRFRIAYSGHECQWNGPSWPFATSITLTGMANLLDDYEQNMVSEKDYFNLLKIYTKSQHRLLDDGRVVPWIDEDLNPTNGDWIARTVLNRGRPAIPERGKDYNHSTYCDLIISGLVGLRPRADETVEVHSFGAAVVGLFLPGSGAVSWAVADHPVGQDGRALPQGQGTAGFCGWPASGLRRHTGASDRPAAAATDPARRRSIQRRLGEILRQSGSGRPIRHLFRRLRCSRTTTCIACGFPGVHGPASPWWKARTACNGAARRKSSLARAWKPGGKATSTARWSSSARTAILCGTPGRRGSIPASVTPPARTV